MQSAWKVIQTPSKMRVLFSYCMNKNRKRDGFLFPWFGALLCRLNLLRMNLAQDLSKFAYLAKKVPQDMTCSISVARGWSYVRRATSICLQIVKCINLSRWKWNDYEDWIPSCGPSDGLIRLGAQTMIVMLVSPVGLALNFSEYSNRVREPEHKNKLTGGSLAMRHQQKHHTVIKRNKSNCCNAIECPKVQSRGDCLDVPSIMPFFWIIAWPTATCSPGIWTWLVLLMSDTSIVVKTSNQSDLH